MSDEKPRKKKSILKVLVMVGGALTIAGASGAGGYVIASKSASHIGDNKTGPKDSPRRTKENTDHVKGDLNSTEQQDNEQRTYLPFEKDFTSNLLEQERFVQASLTLSFIDSKESESPVKEHEAALRSAILAVLADQSATDLSTANGKNRLRIILRNAVNDAIEGIDGTRPVDEVLFTNFIIQ